MAKDKQVDFFDEEEYQLTAEKISMSIVKIRKDLDLKIKDVATAINMHDSNYGQIEKATSRCFSIREIMILLEYFNPLLKQQKLPTIDPASFFVSIFNTVNIRHDMDATKETNSKINSLEAQISSKDLIIKGLTTKVEKSRKQEADVSQVAQKISELTAKLF